MADVKAFVTWWPAGWAGNVTLAFLSLPAEVNVGGIVAAVVVLLIVLGLVAFGIWFAYSRGFFSSKY